MTTTPKVGGRSVSVEQAHDWVNQYLNGARGEFGYPSYDGYTTNHNPLKLCDGDFLAPVLLNVGVKISSFADMKAIAARLDEALATLAPEIDAGTDIVDAGDSTTERVGALFEVLDDADRPRSVQGTTLAKVLHRKVPALIPLYDEQVRRVYQDEDGPLPPVSGRPWAEFMKLFATAVRDDLNANLDTWDELRSLAPTDGPDVSRIRVIDIVAWRLGSGGT